MSNEPNPNPDPATPPATPPAPSNEDAKYRRLFEQEESKRKALEAELQTVKTQLGERDNADKTEREKLATRLAELEQKNQAALRREMLQKAKAEAGLPASIKTPEGDEVNVDDLLVGETEEEIAASAKRIAALMKTPVQAGTVTQPPKTPAGPTLQERLAQAVKDGNVQEMVRLKREITFGGE